jgi:hypothetical protein
MNTDGKITGTADRKVILTTMWVFVMFNYLYCDVMGLMDSVILKQFLEGKAAGMDTTQGFFLTAAILMEIPMAMVLLSMVLKYKANRWSNIIAGTIMTVVQFSSLFIGSAPTIYYMFFSIVEIACTTSIVWLAWRWRNPGVQSKADGAR